MNIKSCDRDGGAALRAKGSIKGPNCAKMRLPAPVKIKVHLQNFRINMVVSALASAILNCDCHMINVVKSKVTDYCRFFAYGSI